MEILQGVDVGRVAVARYLCDEVGTIPHQGSTHLVARRRQHRPHLRGEPHGVGPHAAVGGHCDRRSGSRDRPPRGRRHERLVTEPNDDRVVPGSFGRDDARPHRDGLPVTPVGVLDHGGARWHQAPDVHRSRDHEQVEAAGCGGIERVSDQRPSVEHSEQFVGFAVEAAPPTGSEQDGGDHGHILTHAGPVGRRGSITAMDAFAARRTIASIRAAVGVGALLAPRLTAHAFGIDADANPAAPYLTRLFGARELYLASPFLMPAPGLDEQELASRAIPVDACDTVAALAAGFKGYLPWRAAVPATVVAALGTYLGTQAARPA